MIRSLLVTTALLAAGPALANGFEPAPAPAPAVVVPVAAGTDWTGAYAGLQYELGSGTAVNGGDFDVDAYGIFGGYRYDFGSYVLGGEIDYLMGEFDFNGTALDVDSLLRIGVEAGYDAGPALIYATVGYAHLEVSNGGSSGDGDGYFYGLGLDYLIAPNITLGAEILHHEFQDFLSTAGNDFDFTTFGINVAYRF